jgi:hypothetical protein
MAKTKHRCRHVPGKFGAGKLDSHVFVTIDKSPHPQEWVICHKCGALGSRGDAGKPKQRKTDWYRPGETWWLHA